MRNRFINTVLIAALACGLLVGPGANAGENITHASTFENSAFDSKAKPYSRKPSSEALAWADKELKRMSLDEKIGQLISVGINATFLNQDRSEEHTSELQSRFGISY